MIKKKNSNDSVGSNKSNKQKDWISFLSNNILNGTFGILLFNGVFSLIFSLYYLLHNQGEENNSFFNDNLILIPILMTKFHYFTLNYYCTYTSETTKKFQLISSSALISFYILLFNGVMTVLNAIIPDDNNNKFIYFNIFYFIQIISSIIPAFVVMIFIFGGLLYSTGILDCLYHCNCQDCKKNFFCHQFLFCLCSFICCFGGLWIRTYDIENDDYECCNFRDCSGVGNCNIYCIENNVYCCYKDKDKNEKGEYCCSCERKNCFINIFNELNFLLNITEKIRNISI